MPAEHRGEGALACIAGIERDIDDPRATREAFEREWQACLLTPFAEGHADLRRRRAGLSTADEDRARCAITANYRLAISLF